MHDEILSFSQWIIFMITEYYDFKLNSNPSLLCQHVPIYHIPLQAVPIRILSTHFQKMGESYNH